MLNKVFVISFFCILTYTSIFGTTFTSSITAIQNTEIDYTNSIGNLYVGLDYKFSLNDSAWVTAESNGYLQYSPSSSGNFTLPIDIFQLFPKMFFRLRVSESPLHDFVDYEVSIQKFVINNYLDLDNISQISRFRSGMGHDYSDDFESCRSMKHYFNPNVSDYTTIEIFSPVDGTILSMVESNGIRIHIRSSEHPEYQFIIFHIDALPSLEVGDFLSAGEKIGNHINNTTISDIAVKRSVLHDGIFKSQLISYFDVMTDEHFISNYASSEITDRTDLIISAEERDASPLLCEGEVFVGEILDGGYGSISNWAVLE